MKKLMFVCGRNTSRSPSVGIPVYVSDEALAKRGFPRSCRGGTIIQDLSFYEQDESIVHCFKVRHKNGDHVWAANELVEIGAQFDVPIADIIPNSIYDH